MPYLTVQEIETIAERIVRAYHRYCAQQNQTVTRIDPEIVTSNVLGLQIAYHKLSRFGHVLGLTCMLPVQIQVFDDREEKNNLVPVWERATITLEEAAAYTGIGVRKLREMTDEPTCDYVMWVGNRRMIKRRKLDEYLENAYSV